MFDCFELWSMSPPSVRTISQVRLLSTHNRGHTDAGRIDAAKPKFKNTLPFMSDKQTSVIHPDWIYQQRMTCNESAAEMVRSLPMHIYACRYLTIV